MKAVVCTEPGCGKTVAVQVDFPADERGARMRTRRHKKPDGGPWCTVYAIEDDSVVFEIDAREHTTARTTESHRLARREGRRS